MLFKIDVAFASRPTWVERLSGDRLCLVRKPWNSRRPKPTEYIEVYEEAPEHRYHVKPDPPQHHIHQHNHNHQHFVHYDRPSVPAPNVQVDVDIDKSKGPVAPPPSPTVPQMASQSHLAPPPSPTYETREPSIIRSQPQMHSDAVRYRNVPVEKVRVQRVRVDLARHHRRDPPARRESIREGTYIYMPVRGLNVSNHEISSSGPDPESAVWDEDLGAYVVRRAPRVRFE